MNNRDSSRLEFCGNEADFLLACFSNIKGRDTARSWSWLEVDDVTEHSRKST